MKHFLNHPHQLVQDALEGLVAASGGQLLRLDGFPAIKVVVRADWQRDRVALVSGGGSGHEPAHAGFVGRGMLTAAVAGEVFASPSVEAVLAAILAVTGEAGCLLIIKNYTGDRLNFGLAAELARAQGLQVETVLVGDDVALPEAIQPRGLAGTLLVHKLAGALAETGAGLDEVAVLARRVASSLASVGLALSSCHPPGQSEERIAEDEAELGLGIHGEAGADTIPLLEAEALVSRLLEKLPGQPTCLPGDGPPCALLLNNLGGVPPLEMNVVAQAVLRSALAARVEWLVGPAALMTAYDMVGFSVSLLPLDDEFRRLLLAPTEVAAWPPARPVRISSPLPLPPALQPKVFRPSTDQAVEAGLRGLCAVLLASEADLNALDARTGDGDTGSTLARAAEAILDSLQALPLGEPATLRTALGQILARRMGGSSGVLLSILLAAAGQSRQSWPLALQHGLLRMQEHGGAPPGHRTFVDALAPALEAWASSGLAAAARAAREGALSTAELAALSGRSAYIPNHHLQGVVDPGAEAVARIFEAAARTAVRED